MENMFLLVLVDLFGNLFIFYLYLDYLITFIY